MRSLILALVCSLVVFSASAELMDRPGGFRIGQRLVIRPYVSFSTTFDNNVTASAKDEEEDVIWSINPGFNFKYSADRWYISGSGYYNYNAYSKHHNSTACDYHNYGETLTFGWDTSSKHEPGWSLILNENYRLLNTADDIRLSNGSTYGRDSQEFNFTGVLERRITERVHANVNAGYYWLDYDNSGSGNSLYGWSRWTAGTEVGYVASKWFDLLLNAGYQDYSQDNVTRSAYGTSYWPGRMFGSDSKGVTLHAGFGSYATERISYRLLAGWTRFEYAGGSNTADGMTYSASGNWRIGETWNLMLLASSYYQPSEREYAASQRTDSLSMGVAKSLIRGKLTATADACYRREANSYHSYPSVNSRDYDLDIITFRFGLNYILNRYLTLFARGEYRDSICDSNGGRHSYYDYERLRASLGFRLTY